MKYNDRLFTLATVVLAFAAVCGASLVAAENELCRAAIYRGPGASDTCAQASLEILNSAPNCEAKFVSAEEIQHGALKDFDVVLFPGGTGSGERRALGESGWRELRAFLENGGGYYGTCAGGYMALYSSEREEGRLINAELHDDAWERGEKTLEIEMTEEGLDLFGKEFSGRLNVSYQNGPIIVPANYDKLEPYRVLAYFRTEVAENDSPVGVQIDSPAIAYGPYGKGRVLICSPHPELTPNMNVLVPKLARFAANK